MSTDIFKAILSMDAYNRGMVRELQILAVKRVRTGVKNGW